MASSKSTRCNQVPLVHHYKLVDGMDLEKWLMPADHTPGTKIYKKMALEMPLVKNGDAYTIVIELRDPKIRTIEFVLKDERRDKWLKVNGGNFQISIPEIDANASLPPIPKELIERKAYLLWESKGRPVSSPSQQKQDYDNFVRELQQMLSKGVSLDEIRNSFQTSSNPAMTISKEKLISTPAMAINKEKPSSNPAVAVNKEKLGGQTSHAIRRRHDVEQWLHKCSREQAKSTSLPQSALIDLLLTSMGADNVIQQQSYHIGIFEIAVLLKVVKSFNHILIAGNTKGATVLHWGMAKSSPKEWLAPPAHHQRSCLKSQNCLM